MNLYKVSFKIMVKDGLRWDCNGRETLRLVSDAMESIFTVFTKKIMDFMDYEYLRN